MCVCGGAEAAEPQNLSRGAPRGSARRCWLGALPPPPPPLPPSSRRSLADGLSQRHHQVAGMLRRGQPLWWLVAAAAIAVALAPQAFVQHTDCASCVAAGFGWSLKKAKCGMFANHECGDSPPPPPPPPPPVDDDAAVISATFAQEGPLGLKFGKRASTAPEGWDVVSIATVQSDTQATQHPALVPGLILHSINGVTITGLRYAEAIQLLKATPRPTTLTFRPGPPPPPPPPPRRKKPSSSPAPAPGSTRDVGVVLSTAGLTFAEQRAQALAQHAKTGACGGMDCYRATLARDLVPWSADGISREVFEKTRTYNINAGRMNHYQIIGGRLYRSGAHRWLTASLCLCHARTRSYCTHTAMLSCASLCES